MIPFGELSPRSPAIAIAGGAILFLNEGDIKGAEPNDDSGTYDHAYRLSPDGILFWLRSIALPGVSEAQPAFYLALGDRLSAFGNGSAHRGNLSWVCLLPGAWCAESDVESYDFLDRCKQWLHGLGRFSRILE